MQNERDDVEKVLAALGRAEAPEGLEARIAQGLERRALAVRDAEFRWRDLLAGSAAAGVWWRGAVAGVAASMLVVGAVFLAGHFVRASGGRGVSRAPSSGSAMNVATGVRADRASLEPCARAGEVWVRKVAAVQGDERGQVKGAVRWYPIPGPPLTAEERDLVRVARVGDLKELATLNPEIRERLEAEDAAQFQSFFAEPVKAVSVEPAATETAEPVSEIPAAEPVATQPAGTEIQSEPTPGGDK